jgi:NHLM bacteriocin system ABC transporter ATP-binding protein
VGASEQVIEAASNRVLSLHDPAAAWVVEEGAAHAFVVACSGARRYLFTVERGQALFGLPAPDGGVGLIATGIPGTRLRRRERHELWAQASDDTGRTRVMAAVDAWVHALSTAARDRMPPQRYRPIRPGVGIALADGEHAEAESDVVWVVVCEGRVLFGGAEAIAISPGDPPFPLSHHAYVRAVGPARIVAVPDADVLAAASTDVLDRFHRAVLTALANHEARAAAEAAARLAEQAAVDARAIQQGVARLVAVSDPGRRDATLEAEDPLLGACRLVGGALGIEIQTPPDETRGERDDALDRIVRASRVRLRRVSLHGQWWREDHGPLLGILREDSRPVALLPISARRYELVDPIRGTRVRVDAAVAGTMAPAAWTFYRRFPDRPLTVLDVLGFGMRDARGDLATVLAMGILGGLLGLAVPLATGALIGRVIPGGDRPGLAQLALALAASAFGAAAFQVTRGIAMLRVEGRMGATLQAGVWDRLISLPVPFFRKYAAGDLAVRAMGIETIRGEVTGAVVTSLLGGLFSVFSYALLFAYSLPLALLATAVLVATITVTAMASALGRGPQRARFRLLGQLSAMVLQFLIGIAKLRVAGAEPRAFGAWAGAYADQSMLARRTQTLAVALNVCYAVLPLLALMALFAADAAGGGSRLSTPAFLAFNAAFGQVVGAAVATGVAVTSALQVIPIYERAAPILQTEPEIDATRAHPGELSGAVEVSHVTFRYHPGGPPVLADVSLRAGPGEFVALVGPSGSGKSTLARLLLGFESPEAGAVLYDGQDLSGLDLRAVRRQIGVVVQNARVIPGDILTNIIGSTGLGLEDAWAAARMAGLEDDIKRMPMGMHTIIMEGGGTFSGGQRQRLMIARALVARPRLLLFDEATSALDNRTQAIVSQSLEALRATRIVIAHRLSTIMKADRIYVFQSGRVVQSGTYDALMREENDLFARLARRQLA